MSYDFLYKNLYYLAKSNIHGHGVFAKENIEPDVIIEIPKYTILPYDVYSSNIIFTENEKKILKKYKILDFSCYTSKIPVLIDNDLQRIAVIPLTSLNFVNWANNESDINIRGFYDLNSYKIIIKSIKYIKKDEELLIKKEDGPLTNIDKSIYNDF